jgi:hemoglobin
MQSVYAAAGGDAGLLRLARAIACFDAAMGDVGLDPAGPLWPVLHDYFAWATTTMLARYHASAGEVPEGLSIPRWSWDGLQS